jgi:hypothetical protein
MFLVGDAPPIQRNDGVPPYTDVAREGASRGITINAIRCGTNSETAAAWREIAQIGHGEYASIDEDGGVHQVATGFDAKMAEISSRIDSNTVILGADRRAAYEGKMAATKAAPVTVQADRGAYYGATGSRDDADAVGAIANGTTTVEAIPADSLPPELQHLTQDELKTELNRRVEERKALNKELLDLKAKRAEALKGHGGNGFDAKVKQAIDVQLQ